MKGHWNVKEEPQSAKDRRDQPDVHKLLSTQMRRELVRLKEKMVKYEVCLAHLCDQFEVIKNAIDRADEAANSLLDDDVLQAFAAIRRLQQNVEQKGCVDDDDWLTADE